MCGVLKKDGASSDRRLSVSPDHMLYLPQMKCKSVTALLTLILVIAAPAFGQPFTPVPLSVEPMVFGGIVTADFDADGFLDVLMTGSEAANPKLVTKLYLNDSLSVDGRVILRNAQHEFKALKNPSLEAGDYDNDGDIDLLYSGSQGVIIYRNDGAAGFTGFTVWVAGNTSPGSYIWEVVNAPAAVWGDYDRDGDLDILVGHPSKTTIFRNEGNDRFVDAGVTLPPLTSPTVAWGDYDGDGDLDILLVHRPLQGEPFTRIYRNDRALGFNESGAVLPGIRSGSVAWADYDNDRDLDVLIMSNSPLTDNAAISGIYRNDGETFVKTADTFVQAAYADWMDFNGDGKLDVFVNGSDVEGTFIRFYRQGEQGFEALPDRLPGVWFGDIVTGDIDRDGDLDVLMTGRVIAGKTTTPQVTWLRNEAPARTKTPPPPVRLDGYLRGDVMTLSWSPYTSETDTVPALVTYNIRIGTQPGAGNIVSGMALPDGTRLVPGPGNTGLNTTITFVGLDPYKDYYWSVQAVDYTGTASTFTTGPRILGIGRINAGSRPGKDLILDNFPNPFNPQTTIRYSLETDTQVHVAVYNVLGAEVAVLVDGYQPAGVHETVWEGRDAAGRQVPSGLYLYRLRTPDMTVTRTMVLLK